MAWTPIMTDRLRELHGSEKLTCSGMAYELNQEFLVEITRNAVIGKLSRLGLVQRAPRGGGLKQRVEAKAHRLAEKPAKAPEPATVPILDQDIPAHQRRSLLELEPYHCRWPVGEPGTPGFFFCAAWAVEDRPYCAHHCRVAYTPAVARVRPPWYARRGEAA